MLDLRRRDFITLLGGAGLLCAAKVRRARAQQAAMPVVGCVQPVARWLRAPAAFAKGLSESGYVEGQNVFVEYHWLGGQNDRLPSLMADLVRRRVAVIATAGDPPTLAAKAATETIPIAFGVSGDPVRHGLVASLARPGGNATGINFFTSEVLAKRLGLLHELVPKAVRVALLVNPTNTPSAEPTLRDVPEAARAIGLQIQVLNASTSADIEAAFATLAMDRADALFVAPDGFFNARRVQLATLTNQPKDCQGPRPHHSAAADRPRRRGDRMKRRGLMKPAAADRGAGGTSRYPGDIDQLEVGGLPRPTDR